MTRPTDAQKLSEHCWMRLSAKVLYPIPTTSSTGQIDAWCVREVAHVGISMRHRSGHDGENSSLACLPPDLKHPCNLLIKIPRPDLQVWLWFRTFGCFYELGVLVVGALALRALFGVYIRVRKLLETLISLAVDNDIAGLWTIAQPCRLGKLLRSKRALAPEGPST